MPFRLGSSGRMASTTVEQARERLIERIRDLAYLYSENEDFTLASGRKSKHFFDMKPVMMDPECAHLLGVLIHHQIEKIGQVDACLLYTSPSPRDRQKSRMPSSA